MENHFSNTNCHKSNFLNEQNLVTAAHKSRALQILQNYLRTNFIKYNKVNNAGYSPYLLGLQVAYLTLNSTV